MYIVTTSGTVGESITERTYSDSDLVVYLVRIEDDELVLAKLAGEVIAIYSDKDIEHRVHERSSMSAKNSAYDKLVRNAVVSWRLRMLQVSDDELR